MGQSGSTVASSLATLATRLAANTTPADTVGVVTMNWGANEGADMTDPTQRAIWVNDYLSVIDMTAAKYYSAHFYLMRPAHAGMNQARMDALAQGIDEVIAARPSLVSLGPDERVWFKGSDNFATMSYDGTHYSPAGNSECAAQWQTVLQ